MIIELSEEFDSLFDQEEWSPYASAVENLITAHMNGWHVFLPSRPVLRILSEATEILSRRQIATVQGIYMQYPTFSGLAKEIAFTALAMTDDQAAVPERPNQSMRIRLNVFATLSAAQKFRLLVENANTDGAFYKALCECISKVLHHWGTYDFDMIHGGGNTVASLYEQCLQEPRPTLCIVDSDQLAPFASLGDTARRLKPLIGMEHFPTVAAQILPVRTAENLIPMAICRELCHDAPSCQDAISKVERLENHALTPPAGSAGKEYIRFFDIKNGMKRSDLSSVDHTTAAYLKGMWSVLDPREAEFDTENYEACENIICDGISSNLLHHFISYARRAVNRDRVRAAIRRGPLSDDITELAATILAFAVAPQIDRAY